MLIIVTSPFQYTATVWRIATKSLKIPFRCPVTLAFERYSGSEIYQLFVKKEVMP
jgi:hypothetical protein